MMAIQNPIRVYHYNNNNPAPSQELQIVKKLLVIQIQQQLKK